MPEATKLRIPLVEHRPYFYGGPGRDLYLAGVAVQGQKFSFKANFLLDTGAVVSLLTEHDLKAKAGLQMRDYKAERSVAIGNVPISLKRLGKCFLRMRNAESGNEISFEQDLYGAIKRGLRDGVFILPTASIRSLPNILGTDFLHTHNLGITPRDEKGIRYLFRD